VGDEVALALDGVPIKRWRVELADEIGPMASEWKVSAVRVESKQPLVVALDGPIDGRDADYLAMPTSATAEWLDAPADERRKHLDV